MQDVKAAKRDGWEVAREVEASKPTIGDRAVIEKEKWKTIAWYGIVFALLFVGACWLAGNPFEFTQRIPSDYVQGRGWVGTNEWTIVWWVVLTCAFFEFMDSAGGMGYGTALTPLLLLGGFDPKQIVPLVMITEMVTGLVSGLIHGEFENVEWKFSPMNETTKLVLLIAVTGMAASMLSITAVYKILQVHKFWIRLYVAILLIVMAV